MPTGRVCQWATKYTANNMSNNGIPNAHQHPRIVPKGYHRNAKYDTKALDKSYARHEAKSKALEGAKKLKDMTSSEALAKALKSKKNIDLGYGEHIGTGKGYPKSTK